MVSHWVKGKKILPNDRKKLFNVDLEFVQFSKFLLKIRKKKKEFANLGISVESDGR